MQEFLVLVVDTHISIYIYTRIYAVFIILIQDTGLLNILGLGSGVTLPYNYLVLIFVIVLACKILESRFCLMYLYFHLLIIHVAYVLNSYIHNTPYTLSELLRSLE